MSTRTLERNSSGRPTLETPAAAYEPAPPLPSARDRSQPLTDPMFHARNERASAVAQIHRSLDAWRDPGRGASAVMLKQDDGKKDEPARNKPVNLPAWKDVIIDLGHITSGHVAGGSRASAKKDKFPAGMSAQKIESVVRSAYKVCKRLQTQGDRVLVVGSAEGLTIEMWVNTASKTIETAYPQY